jgi:hypothetical protein
VRRDWRRWLPLGVFPLACIAVFSSAEVNRDRFLLPSLGVLAVFAGAAIAWVAVRSRALAVAVALLAAGPPLLQSARYVVAIGGPGTRDVAVDRLTAGAVPGARILTTLPELGLDRTRFEVVAFDAFDERAALAAPFMDHVVTTGAPEGLDVVSEVVPGSAHAGPRIALARARRPRALRAVPLTAGDLAASENAGALALALDGDLGTRWESAAPQTPGTWLEVRLPPGRPLAGVDLALGERPRHFAANLHVFALGEAGEWTRMRVAETRPPVAEQLGHPSQSLVFAPVRTRGLRLVQVGRRVRPWSIAELRVYEDPGAP